MRSTPDSTTTSTQANHTQLGSEAGLTPNSERQPAIPRPPGSPAETRAVINEVLTGGNALACNPPFVTRHYLNASYGGREGCVKARTSGGVPDRIDLKSLQIEGDHATAVVIPSGGPSDGERATVILVAEAQHPGGRPHWTIDALHSNVPVGP